MVRKEKIDMLNTIIHPGETLMEVLADRQITVKELSEKTKVFPEFIELVIAGKCGISPQFAAALEEALNIEASFWLDLQKNYDKEMIEYSFTLAGRLEKHAGHNVVIVKYGDWDDPVDICLECEDCNEVILDAEIYDITAKEGM